MKKLLIILFLFSSLILHATKYYVKNSGSDAANGLTIGTAWQTVAKTNDAVLTGADSVLFNRGDTWREQIVPNSGSAGNYVYYGAYGTGAKPKFLGSLNRSLTSNWTNVSGNIWSSEEITAVGTGSELILNPGFEANTTNWTGYDNGAQGAVATLSRTTTGGEFRTGSAGGKLACTNNGTSINSVQLWTDGFDITVRQWYKFTFWAKATSSFSIPSIRLMNSLDPWQPFYSKSNRKSANITTDWVLYTVYYQANATTANGRICLFMGNLIPDGATLYIDDISFKTCVDPGGFGGDVGNLIFNNESNCGIKQMSANPTLDTQGDFWYDYISGKLKIYSVGNPATFYTNIECALSMDGLVLDAKTYVSFQNLDFRYWGAYVWKTGGDYITFKDLDISFIGGTDQNEDYAIRYGNGLQIWQGQHDITIERCKIDNCYDAGISPQGNTASHEIYNIYIRNNIISNCEYSFEFWEHPETASAHDIYFENNTCVNAGSGWSHNQRPDGVTGNHVIITQFTATKSNIYIRNNIFYGATEGLFRFLYLTDLTNMVIDNNLYVKTGGEYIAYKMDNATTYTTLATFKTAISQEVHSVGTNPLFASTLDYHLLAGSPARDAGVSNGLTTDFDNNTRGLLPDIGAYELKPFMTRSANGKTIRIGGKITRKQ